MSGTHAILSPSGAHRWMNCAGSPVLEEGEPNPDNEHSKEGSLAHAVAAHCLENKIDSKDIMFFSYRKKTEIVSMDMREYVQEYLDYVRERAAGPGKKLMVEVELDLEPFTGEKATGTADKLIIDLANNMLDLTDLKYGFREVTISDNYQLLLYLLCARDQFSALGEFTKMRMAIFQPRIENFGEEIVTAEELDAFEVKVRKAVKRVAEARKSNSLDGFLTTGSHCTWCRAAGKCPKLTAEMAATTGADFDDETQHELTAPVDLSAAGAKLGLIEIWAKGVRTKIEAEILAGREVKGWKLVEGKRGNRKWLDETEAKALLQKCGAKVGDIEVSKLKTPKQIEKALKGNARALKKLPDLYSQKSGRPGVAPLSDRRPAYTPKPEDDFEDVGDDE